MIFIYLQFFFRGRRKGTMRTNAKHIEVFEDALIPLHAWNQIITDQAKSCNTFFISVARPLPIYSPIQSVTLVSSQRGTISRVEALNPWLWIVCVQMIGSLCNKNKSTVINFTFPTSFLSWSCRCDDDDGDEYSLINNAKYCKYFPTITSLHCCVPFVILAAWFGVNIATAGHGSVTKSSHHPPFQSTLHPLSACNVMIDRRDHISHNSSTMTMMTMVTYRSGEGLKNG